MYQPSNNLERRIEEMKALKAKLKKPAQGKRNSKQSIDEFDVGNIDADLPVPVQEMFVQMGNPEVKTENDLTEYLKTVKSKPIQLK
jgi:hypothetical protein